MRSSQLNSIVKSMLLVCAALAISVAAFAAPPPMFSYQGRLTDPGGNPVPDGIYSVEFRIWNAPAAGVMFWTSGPVSVTTADGLFSAKIGESPQPPLPVAIFYDSMAYVGVKVGADPEIAPRTQIVAAPYSLTTGTLESSQGGRVFGDLYMNNGGFDYVQTSQFNHAIGTFNASSNAATRLWGPSYGELDLFDNSGAFRGAVTAGFSDFPTLSLLGNANSINLIAGVVGDNCVQFPSDAVNSLEILDEPGITQNVGSLLLGAAPGTYENVNSVTITTPAPGYIVVTADGETGLSGPAATTVRVTFGLGEISVAPPTNGSYFIGNTAAPNAATYSEQYSTSMVSVKPAGTYTFYQTATRANATTSAFFYRSHMRAIYFPTSYGAVVTPVPPSEATAFSESSSFSDEKTGSPMKLVDLRELELKAAKLKAESDAAELALVKARLKQNTNNANVGTTTDDKR